MSFVNFGNHIVTNNGNMCSINSVSMGSASVVVDGVTYSGKSVRISNGRVYVDGVEKSQLDNASSRPIEVVVNGNVESVSITHGTVNVTGDAGSAGTTSGDVYVGRDVKGSARTVSGNIKVKGKVGGSVSTVSGDIRHYK